MASEYSLQGFLPRFFLQQVVEAYIMPRMTLNQKSGRGYFVGHEDCFMLLTFHENR